MIIDRFDELDSTSRLARRRIESGENVLAPFAIVAQRQTRGVGRFGRAWASPEGGLWFTLIWPLPHDAAEILKGLGLRIGVACLLAVRECLAQAGAQASTHLKWPNDILVNGRKALGVLTETITRADRTFALIGVGVNANFEASALPEALRASATTLQDAAGAPVSVEGLLDVLLRELGRALESRAIPARTLAIARASLFGVSPPTEPASSDTAPTSPTLLGLNDEGEPIYASPLSRLSGRGQG